MLRLLERVRTGLFAFLLTALVAWALVLPALGALGLPQAWGMALLYALLASLLISLHGLLPHRLRFLAPLALILFFALGLALRPGSWPARLGYFVRGLLSGAPGEALTLIYLDALLPLLLLLLALFARLLLEGDPAFTLTLLVTPPVLLWLLGARAELPLYFPLALSLPLAYVYLNLGRAEEQRLARPGSLLPRALALALALALAASLLAPQERRVQPAMARLAEDIRRRVEDLFFFNATRNMFTLRSQGWQPMGESGLGGPPEISNHSVMNVRTDQLLYLRGTALDHYNGRQWADTLSSQRHGWNSLRWQGLRAELFNEALPRDERALSQQAQVTLLSQLPSTLFVPQRLRKLSPGPDLVPYFNASSEVFVTRDLQARDSYSFTYEPYVAGEASTDALARRLAQDSAQRLPELPREYFQLPPHLEPDGIVAQLARDITGQADSPYAQALLLMRHLRANYAYTLEVPWAPESQDFAAHFLFDLKAGYCTYFATAMTVLARSISLPARYVEGFLARPGEGPSVTLSGRDAHAWTEIYIAGLGWVVFDATAPREEQEPQGGDQPPPPPSPSPSPTTSPSPSPEPSPEQSPQPSETPAGTPSPPPEPGHSEQPSPAPDSQPDSPGRPDTPFPFWWLLLLALALFAWQVQRQRPQVRARRLKEPGLVLAMYWQETLRTLRAGGRGIQPGETPLAYARRVDAGEGGLRQLARARSAQVYGRARPDAQQAAQAAAVYQALWAALPAYRKPGLALARAVAPLGRALRLLPSTAWTRLKALAGRLGGAAHRRWAGFWRRPAKK